MKRYKTIIKNTPIVGQMVIYIGNIIRWYKKREKRQVWGNENPDKIFYVIGHNETLGGLWWIINQVLMHIAYCKDNGYIPVVDFLNYYTQYSESETSKNTNDWELFFEQPSGISLTDISKSKNIIINKMAAAPQKKYLMGHDEFYDNPQRIIYFQTLFNRYIHFNASAKAYLDNMYKRIFRGKDNVVGVLCRGTDYVLLKPKGHPVQPEVSVVIEDVKKCMIEYNCDNIFLATEDADIFDVFFATFGEKLLYIDQKRIHKKDMDGISYLSQENKKVYGNTSAFIKGMSYMSATYLLSKCKCFISGRTGGAKGVLLMSSGFSYTKIYNLGLYA